MRRFWVFFENLKKAVDSRAQNPKIDSVKVLRRHLSKIQDARYGQVLREGDFRTAVIRRTALVHSGYFFYERMVTMEAAVIDFEKEYHIKQIAEVLRKDDPDFVESLCRRLKESFEKRSKGALVIKTDTVARTQRHGCRYFTKEGLPNRQRREAPRLSPHGKPNFTRTGEK